MLCKESIRLIDISCSLLPAPKRRVRVIMNTLLITMSMENFVLTFGRTVLVWCIGAVAGWLFVPLIGANTDVLLCSHIPVTMQGRLFSVRNTLQFFTIPIGYFLGGILVCRMLEAIMTSQTEQSLLVLASAPLRLQRCKPVLRDRLFMDCYISDFQEGQAYLGIGEDRE